jgi:hypothetical protein
VNLGQSFGRRLLIIGLLAVLGLMRAERGVAELEGRTDQPSQLFRLEPNHDSDTWTIVLFGRETQVASRIPLYDRGGPLLERLHPVK